MNSVKNFGDFAMEDKYFISRDIINNVLLDIRGLIIDGKLTLTRRDFEKFSLEERDYKILYCFFTWLYFDDIDEIKWQYGNQNEIKDYISNKWNEFYKIIQFPYDWALPDDEKFISNNIINCALELVLLQWDRFWNIY